MACNRPSLANIQSAINSTGESLTFTITSTSNVSFYAYRFYVYDKYGELVGGSASDALIYSGTPIEITVGLDYLFNAGDEFSIYGYGRWGGYKTDRLVQFNLSGEFTTTSTVATLESGINFSFTLIDTSLSGSASYLGHIGKCAYKMPLSDFLDDYEDNINPSAYNEVICTPPPYEYGAPAKEIYDNTDKGVAEGEEGLYRNVFLYNLFGWTSNTGNTLPDVGSGVKRFFYGVDNNGIIRMSTDLDTLGGAWDLIPILKMVEMSDFTTGSEFKIYYVEGEQLYWVRNPNTDDGKYILKRGVTRLETADLYWEEINRYEGDTTDILEVGVNDIPCPTNLNVSIWGWMDNVEEQVAYYEDAGIENPEHDEWFDDNAVNINNGIFSMADALGLDPLDFGYDPDPSEEGVDDE